MLILTRRQPRKGSTGHEIFCERDGQRICTIAYVDASRMPDEVGLSAGNGTRYLGYHGDTVFEGEIRVQYMGLSGDFGKAVRLGIDAPKDITIIRDDAKRQET